MSQFDKDMRKPYEKLCDCGRKITMAPLPEGGWIPLLKVAVVYKVHEGVATPLNLSHHPDRRDEQACDTFISHFVDCPLAAQHSRGGQHSIDYRKGETP